MLGRQAYQDPYLLAELQQAFLDPALQPPSREHVAAQYADYVERMAALGHRVPLMLRHAQGLYAGQPGARAWRRLLGEHGGRPGAGAEILRDTLRAFQRAA
jgi:tRNA-dihydrouridine synthase A